CFHNTPHHRYLQAFPTRRSSDLFEMKADYIEIDVQMTKDKELVAIHDTTVNRTTNGVGAVGDYTLEELQQLDAGSWFSDDFSGEKIPTFGEILDTYRGKIGILIE